MIRFIASLLFLFPLLSAGCSSTGERLLPTDSNRMAPDRAPAPYSADQIREECTPGRTIVLRTVMKPSVVTHQVFRFRTDENGLTTLESWTEDADRSRTSEVSSTVTDWAELQGHASFPEADTRITVEDVTVPIGTYRCWVYDVEASPSEGDAIPMRYCFAMQLPGPPILLIGHPNSHRTPMMTMVEDRRDSR